MSTITIQQLKQTLAAVIERVGLGEWITVMKHGRPVARLGPPAEPGLHVGARFGTGHRIAPFGRRMTRGAYRDVLNEDRQGDRA